MANHPEAPPLPPITQKQETPSIALKTRPATPGWGLIQKSEPQPEIPPTGTYFFYGTLQDPGILSEVLELPQPPVLRPASIEGSSVKLWGQYPALIPDPTALPIHGCAFDVLDERLAGRLAEYETKAYRAMPCVINVREDGSEGVLDSLVFVYVGDPSELSDGSFDLDVWLRRIGRRS